MAKGYVEIDAGIALAILLVCLAILSLTMFTALQDLSEKMNTAKQLESALLLGKCERFVEIINGKLERECLE